MLAHFEQSLSYKTLSCIFFDFEQYTDHPSKVFFHTPNPERRWLHIMFTSPAKCSYTHTHARTQPFNSLLSRTTQVGWYQKNHLPTSLCSFHCCFMYLHSFFTFIVFYLPLLYHMFRKLQLGCGLSTIIKVIFYLI